MREFASFSFFMRRLLDFVVPLEWPNGLETSILTGLANELRVLATTCSLLDELDIVWDLSYISSADIIQKVILRAWRLFKTYCLVTRPEKCRRPAHVPCCFIPCREAVQKLVYGRVWSMLIENGLIGLCCHYQLRTGGSRKRGSP